MTPADHILASAARVRRGRDDYDLLRSVSEAWKRSMRRGRLAEAERRDHDFMAGVVERPGNVVLF